MALKRGVKCIKIQLSISMSQNRSASQNTSGNKKTKVSQLQLGSLVVKID